MRECSLRRHIEGNYYYYYYYYYYCGYYIGLSLERILHFCAVKPARLIIPRSFFNEEVQVIYRQIIYRWKVMSTGGKHVAQVFIF